MAIETIGADFSLLAAALRNARPVELDGAMLTVAFAQDDASTAEWPPRAPTTAARSARRCAALTGAPLRLTFELRDLGGPLVPRRASPVTSWSRGSCESSTQRRSWPSRSRMPSRSPPRTTKVWPDAPAEHAADAQAGPEDAAGHGRCAGAAQARGARGLGRRRHGHRRRSAATSSCSRSRIDPEAIDPEDAELLQDMVTAATNEAIRAAQELAARPPRRRSPAAWAASASRGCRPEAVVRRLRPPVQRLITELGKLPGIGPRTAQRLAFHILRAEPRGRARARRRDPRGEGADRLLRDLLQPRRGPALHDLPRRAPRRRS